MAKAPGARVPLCVPTYAPSDCKVSGKSSAFGAYGIT